MKLSKMLRVIGRGAAIAAEFTPAGAAVTKGLDVAGKVLHQPEAVEDDGPDTLREIAVQAVLSQSGTILAAVITSGANTGVKGSGSGNLEICADAVEAWLQSEALRSAAAEKASGDGR